MEQGVSTVQIGHYAPAAWLLNVAFQIRAQSQFKKTGLGHPGLTGYTTAEFA